MSYNTKNYREQGGERDVIGGELAVIAGGKVTVVGDIDVPTGGEINMIGGSLKYGTIVVRPAIFQVASTASDAAGAVVDLNRLIAKLKANGLMAAIAPTITFTTQPTGASVVVGSVTGNMTVAAVVSDGNTPTYQWYSNASNANSGGSAIGGATSATLAIPTNSSAGTVYYYCVASCEGVTAASNTATIVAVTPVITIGTQPLDVETTAGAITESLLVAATVTGTKTITYQWYSNTSKVTAGSSAIGGATAVEFELPTNLTAATYYYYCVVASAGAVSVTSTIATVTVASGD
jgi:hypothetical protein